ncbi:MAG: carboxyltransferase domain-containing protein, partial [Proteobacteria bacterium]|nr:carboxyltransferase domain-containing protein [Pseudomonadota bacterium]
MNLNIINETLIEYKFSNNISLEISKEVLKIYHYLIENLDYQKLGLIKITPSFNAIAISFKSVSPLFTDPDYLRSEILLARKLPAEINNKIHSIEIIYNGLDLDDVCQSLLLSKQEFINLHQNKTYTIAMLGFKGNFPYLLGLDKNLILPRRASPRNLVKKGSVAIGSEQCGIYAEDSPGG